jgi:DNA-binding beta-propeller fold protein YncE
MTGDVPRAFASDGTSVELATMKHYVDVFSPNGVRQGRLGEPSRVGFGALGTLNAPIAAEWDGDRLLVLERGNARIQAFSRVGDPLGVIAQTALPGDFAVDPRDRTIFVAGFSEHRIEVFGPDGLLLRTVGRFGTDRAGLNGPCSIALASDGSLHVADIGSRSIKVFSAAGDFVASYGDGVLIHPRSIRFDAQGRAWVADTYAAAIRVFDPAGTLVATIEPRTPSGLRGAPMALSRRPDGTLYAAVARAV